MDQLLGLVISIGINVTSSNAAKSLVKHIPFPIIE